MGTRCVLMPQRSSTGKHVRHDVLLIYLVTEPVKPVAAQRRRVHGSILHYIYQHTLGQSLHSQMRRVICVYIDKKSLRHM